MDFRDKYIKVISSDDGLSLDIKSIIKENTMNLKMLKAAFTGLVLLASGFANAGLIDHIIDVTYDGTSSQFTYTGDGNLEQGGTLQLNFAAAPFDYWNNMSRSFWPAILVLPVGVRYGDYSWSYLLDGVSVNTGNVFNDRTDEVHIFNTVNRYRGMFDEIVLNYTLNTSATVDINNIDGTPFVFWNDLPFNADYVEGVAIPEPSTFAIFALGLIGLASRRFKKNRGLACLILLNLK